MRLFKYPFILTRLRVHIYSQNETKKKAEVAAYFKRFEEAERLYLEMDRRY